MAALANTVFCNFPSSPLPKPSLSSSKSLILTSARPNSTTTSFNLLHFSMKQGDVRVRRSAVDSRTPGNEPIVTSEGGGEGGGGGGEERDWTTSFLLFGFWLGVMYYVFFIAPNQTPNQTPATDIYFAKKLLFFIRNDEFEMNKVLVTVWNMMGIWPLVYAMLLVPTARSYKSKIPVWPFLGLSTFLGMYALMPYFVLWRPPSPPMRKSELNGWALKILDSKLTAGIALAGGVAAMSYGFSAGGDAWKEFYQYFRSSKLVNITTIDFILCSTFAPFWVYNDMTTRKWDDKGSWLIPVSAIPLLGPTLYLLLRPSLSSIPALMVPTTDEE